MTDEAATTQESVTVSIDSTGTGWTQVPHAVADVSIATQPSTGTASIEAVDGQDEVACVKVVNATAALVSNGGTGTVSVELNVTATDVDKPGPEPTASESSGTGDQAGGAVEHDEAGAEVQKDDPADEPEMTGAERRVRETTDPLGTRPDPTELSDPAKDEPDEEVELNAGGQPIAEQGTRPTTMSEEDRGQTPAEIEDTSNVSAEDRAALEQKHGSAVGVSDQHANDGPLASHRAEVAGLNVITDRDGNRWACCPVCGAKLIPATEQTPEE